MRRIITGFDDDDDGVDGDDDGVDGDDDGGVDDDGDDDDKVLRSVPSFSLLVLSLWRCCKNLPPVVLSHNFSLFNYCIWISFQTSHLIFCSRDRFVYVELLLMLFH